MSESNLPVIVVCSVGEKTTREIIDNLRKESPDQNTIELCDNTTGYKFHNVTKYYENDIIFLSHESKHLSLIPVELLERIEGFIIYFDSDNKDFLRSLPSYADFMEENNVEFGILLCSELYDNPIDGITYKESKAYSHILDVIELERKQDIDEDEQIEENASHHNPIGYDEVLQAIRAIIWSNVDLKRKVPSTQSTRNDANGETTVRNQTNNGERNESTIESELNGFEQLLTEVMMFKDTTASWSRNERLAYAEKFAYAFDNLLQKNALEDDSSDDSYEESDLPTKK